MILQVARVPLIVPKGAADSALALIRQLGRKTFTLPIYKVHLLQDSNVGKPGRLHLAFKHLCTGDPDVPVGLIELRGEMSIGIRWNGGAHKPTGLQILEEKPKYGRVLVDRDVFQRVLGEENVDAIRAKYALKMRRLRNIKLTERERHKPGLAYPGRANVDQNGSLGNLQVRKLILLFAELLHLAAAASGTLCWLKSFCPQDVQIRHARR
jgi:hypothetical protein